MIRTEPTRTTDRRLLAAGACAALLAILVASLTLIWPGSADSAGLKYVVLGKKVATLPPDCPTRENKDCQTLGRVTGFQSTSGGSRNQPFEAPYAGKIVSWSISLARPSNSTRGGRPDEVAFFNQYFGKPSQARISVLRKVRRTNPPQYRLVRQGPIQILNPYFGSTVEFTLEHPLTVLKGHMVALTVPTWAPAFFHAASCDIIFEGPPPIYRDRAACDRFTAENSWRASRKKGRCNFNSNNSQILQEQINQSYPQQRVGSKKEYGCYYTAARLLYTATVVKKPIRRSSSRAETSSVTLGADSSSVGVGEAREVTP